MHGPRVNLSLVYGAHCPTPLQLIWDGQPVMPVQSAGATQTHDVEASALCGATIDATIGIAIADARPIFLIASRRLGMVNPPSPLSVSNFLSSSCLTANRT